MRRPPRKFCRMPPFFERRPQPCRRSTRSSQGKTGRKSRQMLSGQGLARRADMPPRTREWTPDPQPFRWPSLGPHQRPVLLCPPENQLLFQRCNHRCRHFQATLRRQACSLWRAPELKWRVFEFARRHRCNRTLCELSSPGFSSRLPWHRPTRPDDHAPHAMAPLDWPKQIQSIPFHWHGPWNCRIRHPC